MGLPLLKEFLPEPGIEPEEERDSRALAIADAYSRAVASVEREEALLTRTERRFSSLQAAIAAYIERVKNEQPSPEEVDFVFQDFSSVQEDHLRFFKEQLREAEKNRREILRGTPVLRPRRLKTSDRQIRLLQNAVSVFESAERELLMLRDEALVKETQAAFGAHVWDDDDE
jgi:hypothetical protein